MMLKLTRVWLSSSFRLARCWSRRFRPFLGGRSLSLNAIGSKTTTLTSRLTSGVTRRDFFWILGKVSLSCTRKKKGKKVLKKTKDVFDQLPKEMDAMFWKVCKIAWVTGHFDTREIEGVLGIYRLLGNVFSNFEDCYREYRKLNQSYWNVLAGMTTMMGKCQDYKELQEISDGYRKVLSRCAQHPYPKMYAKNIDWFFGSPKTELDFFVFLYLNSQRDRRKKVEI